MKDCRRTLLDEFVKLSKDWDNNNMLYNSLMFSKLYPGDVENSVADASLMPKQSDEKMRNDIMTSWWTPTKIFLLGNKKELMQKSRKELEEVLLERIPMGKDEEQLRESLSKIRHEKTGEKIEKDVIDAFMGFLGCEFPYKSRVMGTSEPLKPLKAPYMARNPVKWGFFRLKGQEIPLKI